MEPRHPNQSEIFIKARLWHIKTAQYVTLCNCASVKDYRKVGWARNRPSEYLADQPKAEKNEVPL